jgi:hypothetical protein
MENKNTAELIIGKEYFLILDVDIKLKGFPVKLYDFPVLFWIEQPKEETITLADHNGYISSKSHETCHCFYVIASSKPRKTTVKFKIGCDNTDDLFVFRLFFDKHIHPAYSRTIILSFISKKKSKNTNSGVEKKQIKIMGNISLESDVGSVNT